MHSHSGGGGLVICALGGGCEKKDSPRDHRISHGPSNSSERTLQSLSSLRR